MVQLLIDNMLQKYGSNSLLRVECWRLYSLEDILRLDYKTSTVLCPSTLLKH